MNTKYNIPKIYEDVKSRSKILSLKDKNYFYNKHQLLINTAKSISERISETNKHFKLSIEINTKTEKTIEAIKKNKNIEDIFSTSLFNKSIINSLHFIAEEELIPIKTNSVDKIISTFALHWVASIDKALKELKRITKNNCSIDILMVEKNDGKEFKKIVFKIMKKYLSKKQIFNAANLINRLTKNELKKKISYHFNLKNEYSLFLKKKEKIVYGSCNDHLKWWKARSLQFISEVKNKKLYIENLKEELNKYKDKKIPFDLSLLEIHIVKE